MATQPDQVCQVAAVCRCQSLSIKELIQVDSLESPFHFERHLQHAVVAFNPLINEGQWGTVMQVGHEILLHVGNQPNQALVVDLSRLTYIGSPQVALLVRLWKSVKKSNGRMSVECPNDTVCDALSIAGLHSLWQIVATRDAALNAIGIVPPAPTTDSAWNWILRRSSWLLPNRSNRAG